MADNYAYVVPDPHGDLAYSYVDTNRERFVGLNLFQYRHVGQEDQLWKIGSQHEALTPVKVAHRDPGADVPSHGTESFTTTLAGTGRYFYVMKEEVTDDAPIYRWWVIDPTGSTFVVELAPGDPTSILELPDQRVQADFHAMIEDGGAWSIWNMPNILEIAETPIPSDSSHTNLTASTWAAEIMGNTANARVQPEAPDPFTVDLVSHGQHSSDGSSLYFSLFGETGDQFSAWEDASISWSRGAGATGPVPVMNLDVLRVEHIILDVPGGASGGSLPLTALPYNSTLDVIYRRAYRTAAGGEPINAALGQLALVISELNPDTIDPAYCLNVEATITGTSTITPSAPRAYKQSEYRLFNGYLDETSTYFEQGKGLPGSEVMASDFIVQPGRGIFTAVMGQDTDADNYGGGQKFSVAVHFAPGESITIAMGEQRSRFTG